LAVPNWGFMKKNLKKHNYFFTALDLIEKNGSRAQVIKELQKQYGLTSKICTEIFNQAIESLKTNSTYNPENIRSMRIYALEKDIKECYQNYTNALTPAYKIEWFKLYQEAKKRLDHYFPNELKPEVSNPDLKIEIKYSIED
jgi:hypothetical protein